MARLLLLALFLAALTTVFAEEEAAPGAPEVRVLDAVTGRSVEAAVVTVVGSRVFVRCPGYFASRFGHPLATAGHPLAVRVQPSGSLSGRVLTAEGKPVSGAEVTVARPLDSPELHVHEIAFTDATGNFRVSGLPTAELEIRAVLRTKERDFRAIARARPGTEAKLVLSEWSRPSLTVRIVDPEGTPVARARVDFSHMHLAGGLLHSSGGEAERGEWRRKFERSEDHEVVIGLYDARNEDGDPLPLAAVEAGPFDLAKPVVTVTMPRERTIRGVVCDRDGKPVAEARVVAVPNGWLPFQKYRDFPEHGEARTDARGRFTVGRLGDFRYYLFIEPPPPGRKTERVRAPAGARNLRLEVGPAASPVVTVVDPEGKPVPNASVRARDHRIRPGSRPDFFADGVTDHEGRTKLKGLHPDRVYYLSVAPPASRQDLDRGGIDHWSAESTTVRLAVKQPSPAPVPPPTPSGVTLKIEVENPPIGRKVHANVGPVEGVGDLDVSADARGVVRVRGLPAGSRPTVIIRTGPAGLVWMGRDLEPGERPIRARLGPGRTITGRIRLTGKGQHPSIAAETDWLTFYGMVKKDGTFVIRALPDGVYTVRAWQGGTGKEATAILPAGRSALLTIPTR
jgi:protocatechuate 3,4-dioxygenase beta subunit